MVKAAFIVGAMLSAVSALATAQATVRVEPAHLNGSRELAPQTAQAAIRDYLDAWRSMRAAFAQNRPDLLTADFIGTARDKLTDAIHEQAAAGVHTAYRDRAHDLQIVFYSPEGLSIELTDSVDYDVQVFDRDTLVSTQPVHARYIVVLTPAEVRWQVRVMQSQ